MSPAESDLINAKITARKRELHAEAVADVGRRLLDCQHNLVSEAQRLWSTGEMLARSYEQLSTELSDSIAAGDPLDTAILEKAKVALVQVPERLTSVASLHQQSFGLLQRLLDQTGRPPDELEEDPVLLQLERELEGARKNARHEIVRQIRQDDWADLPYFGGESVRERDHCLHCGNDLDPEQIAYCCEHCKEVHQAVFGVSEE